MVRLFKVKELEAKRRALAAESEVYRQTLNLEIQNLRMGVLQAKQKLTGFGAIKRLLMLGAPLFGSMLNSRKSSLFRFVSAALMGWRLYGKASSLFGGLFKSSRPEPQPTASRGEGPELATGN